MGSIEAQQRAAIANVLNSRIAASYKRTTFSLNGEGPPPAAAPAPQASTSTAPAPSASEASPAPKRKARSTDGAAPSSSKRARASGQRSTAPSADKWPAPTTRLRDLGGIDRCIEQVLELVALPICHPEIYSHTGVIPPRGVLLVGPPGCGKTMLAGAIAGELGCPFVAISAPSIVSGMSGESEKTVRDTFAEAAALAPCVLFIDEIDAITGKRENAQREMERRIVAQLLTCMDDLSLDKTDGKAVIVIGATNRPDSLDPALRRAGRFDHEIAMTVPDQSAREQILRVLIADMKLSGDFDLVELAKRTPGYVGADLTALATAAGISAVKRIFRTLGTAPAARDEAMSVDALDISDPSAPPAPFADLPPSVSQLDIAGFLRAHPRPLREDELGILAVTNADFQDALEVVQPSSKREGFTTVPDVTWADVGALTTARAELRMALTQPITRPELFAALGIAAPCGVLLYGPPGCGKTLIAKAVANDSRANFISVKGPELLNKYVGESERAVRQVFDRARASAPCIIFFDELDALVPRRDDSLSESSARVVNTLLTELDGLEPRKQVYVIGATNRPDMIDPAMVRPGRLDKLLFVGLPEPSERADILRTQASRTPLGADVDLVAIAEDVRADGFSGADLSALVREAAVMSLNEAFAQAEPGPPVVAARHFDAALSKVVPSVSAAQRRKYEALRSRYAGQPIGRRDESSAATPAAVVPLA